MDVGKILNKRKWSGKDLGRLLIAKLAYKYERLMAGEADPEPLVNEKKFSAMLETLKTPNDIKTYTQYMTLYDWLKAKPSSIRIYKNAWEVAFSNIRGFVTTAEKDEEMYLLYRKFPAIMTESQYQTLKQERIEASFHDETGEELYYNIFNIIEKAICFYIELLNESPRKNNPLKNIILKYDNEEVKSPIIKKHYEDESETVTKGNVLRSCELLDIYPIDIKGSGNSWEHINFVESMQDFYCEFSEVIDAVIEDMNSKKGIDISNVPLEEWDSTVFSRRELYNIDFYGEKFEIENDINIFNGDKQTLLNGIAIIRPSDLLNKSLLIDEDGNYIQPQLPESEDVGTLRSLFPENEQYACSSEFIESAYEQLVYSYSVLLGYNTQLDEVAKFIDVPAVSVFKIDLSAMNQRFEALCNIIENLKTNIETNVYHLIDKDLQQRKLDVIEDFFPRIKLDDLSIPENDIETMRTLIADFSAFAYENTRKFDFFVYTYETK
jgi:hypothetical protein